MQVTRAYLIGGGVIGLVGCSLVQEQFPDQQAVYEKATSLPSLEIPPDLVPPSVDEEMALPGSKAKTGVTRYSEYGTTPEVRQTEKKVLPIQDDLRVVREGNKRWLVVKTSPEQVWNKVRDFWLDQGFLIKTEDPRIGLLETDWLENRSNIPQSGIRNLLGKVLDGLYDSSTRDRFRIRLERGETPDTTEIYVSHLGAEEVLQGETSSWQTRPNDPELEAVMLQRLMVFMGVQEQKAKIQIAADPGRGEQAHLTSGETVVVEEDFPRAWRHAGLALDRAGFTVEDRDRSKGVYFVRYNDPLKEKEKKGFFARLWSSDTPSEEQYQVQLLDRRTQTEITVLNKEGAPDSSPTGKRILTLLHEQLK